MDTKCSSDLKGHSMLIWHFTNGPYLRNGHPLPPIGKPLIHRGPLIPCSSGLHGSEDILDAVGFAPGSLLHRCKTGRSFIRHNNKVCARRRTILWTIEAHDILRQFAKDCARDVLHLWDAPQVVVDFLNGGESKSDVAHAAALDAAYTTNTTSNNAAAMSANYATYSANAANAATYAAYHAADASFYAADDVSCYGADRKPQRENLLRLISAHPDAREMS